MKFDEMQVVMPEFVKSANMEHDENCHNLAIGHTRRTPSADLALGTQKRHIFNFFFIFLAKFIRSTENFYNFVVGNQECILVLNFISNWKSHIKIQNISQVTNFLDYFLIPN